MQGTWQKQNWTVGGRYRFRLRQKDGEDKKHPRPIPTIVPDSLSAIPVSKAWAVACRLTADGRKASGAGW